MRFIDVDSVITELKADIQRSSSERFLCTRSVTVLKGIVQRLANWPIIDAEVVKHGEWVDIVEREFYYPDGKASIITTDETCSNCKCRTGFVGPKAYLNDSICPHCGAKMSECLKDIHSS